MSKVLISCEQADMKNLMITPYSAKEMLNRIYSNPKIDYKICKIEILRPIQFYKNYLINAKWRVDYNLIPNGKELTIKQTENIQNDIVKAFTKFQGENAYLGLDGKKIPIQIEPDDGKEKPIRMDRDMGEMLYGTEVKNGKLLKKVFQAKVVGGVLDLTKIKEKDLKIIRERGIHPRRSGRGRER